MASDVDDNLNKTYLSILIISGFFALLATIWTARLIFFHTIHYNKPDHQRYVIRILLMIPIYAIDSFLSILLKHDQWSIFLDIFRDCYEAYVIYSFFKLVVCYLGGEEAVFTLMKHKPTIPYTIPFCCWRFQPTRRFYVRCLQAVLQYTVIRPLLAILAFGLNFGGYYGDGSFSVTEGYAYITLINNLSVLIALYYLVVFYETFALELKPHSPLLKFLAIKGVIFFTFWQSVAIVIAGWIGLLPATDSFSVEDIEFYFNNALVCLEMFIAAVVHSKAFPYQVYMVEGSEEGLVEGGRRFIRHWKHEVASGLGDVASQRDVLGDAVTSMKKVGSDFQYKAFTDDEATEDQAVMEHTTFYKKEDWETDDGIEMSPASGAVLVGSKHARSSLGTTNLLTGSEQKANSQRKGKKGKKTQSTNINFNTSAPPALPPHPTSKSRGQKSFMRNPAFDHEMGEFVSASASEGFSDIDIESDGIQNSRSIFSEPIDANNNNNNNNNNTDTETNNTTQPQQPPGSDVDKTKTSPRKQQQQQQPQGEDVSITIKTSNEQIIPPPQSQRIPSPISSPVPSSPTQNRINSTDLSDIDLNVNNIRNSDPTFKDQNEGDLL